MLKKRIFPAVLTLSLILNAWFFVIKNKDQQAIQIVDETASATNTASEAPSTEPTDIQQAQAPQSFVWNSNNNTGSINVNELSRVQVLGLISSELNAELLGVENNLTNPEQLITLQLRDKPLIYILEKVVADANYKIELAYDLQQSQHQIAILDFAAKRDQLPHADWQARKGIPENKAQLMHKKDADAILKKYATMRDEFEFQDTEIRIEILSALSPAVPRDLKMIVDTVINDTEPAVRVKAVKRLRDDSSYLGTQTLLGALRDADTTVVLAATKSLIESRDKTILPSIRQTLEMNQEAEVASALKTLDADWEEVSGDSIGED